MSKLVTIYGGSGFVGRYIARRMALEGWRVRVAVRRPNEALHVRPYGVVGQVEPVLCNIRDDASVRTVMRGADAVVNCVGILAETGKNRFVPVQADGPARVARSAAAEGVAQMVHVSAIGADPASDSIYARTKALGEQGVLENFPRAVILRPSIIFGPEDGFFNRFAAMTRFGPVLPVVGARTRFQPVYVDDVAQAAVMGILGQARPGIYELGGPEICSFRELMHMMLAEIRRKRLIVNIPFGVANVMAAVLGGVQIATLGLFRNTLLTRDQVRQLRRDNVVAQGALGFDALGITPTPMNAVLPTYLWAYRPGGQYSAIRESAGSLR